MQSVPITTNVSSNPTILSVTSDRSGVFSGYSGFHPPISATSTGYNIMLYSMSVTCGRIICCQQINGNVVFHWILNFMVLINHEFHENKYPTNISTFTVIPHYAVESGSYCPPFRSDV